MVQPVRNIVIVGGGTAGWLTAGVIAAKHRSRMGGGFSVTLVESPNTPDHRRGRGHLADAAQHAGAHRRIGNGVLPAMRRRVQAGRALRALDDRAPPTTATITR